MVRKEKEGKELLERIGLPKITDGKIADAFAMTIEFMKYQGEAAYVIARKQAIATTSTVSSIGLGWSAFFFGLVQESWLTSSLGLMLVFVGTYFLAYWTPRVMNKLRNTLDESGAMRFYSKWLPQYAGGIVAEDKP